MIDSIKLAEWIKAPQILEDVPPKEINELIKLYPYFQIGHYLKYLQQPSNDSAWFFIHQVFGVNPVLMDRMKNPFENELISNEEIEQVEAEELIEVEDEIQKEAVAEKTQKSPSFEYPSATDYFSNDQESDFNLSDLAKDFKKQKETLEVAENNFCSDKVLDEDKSLIVVMSFAEWLKYLEERAQKANEEKEGQKALRAMWQRQKLAEALEDEEEEIPEDVFNMAVNSITLEEEIISESMAEVYVKQGKKKHAIDMFKKLSLRNPEKSVYFARKIEILQKEIDI